MKKPWYEELYENYSKQYDKQVFIRGTIGECDFIEHEIEFDKNARILDIGCGTGRHSIELAKRGYMVTGIDFSEAQLDMARQKAEGLNIDFRQYDARDLPFDEKFDYAIMLCEGAFPLMETDEMNFQILKNAAKALRNGGKLIFTTLNGLFSLYNSISDFRADGSEESNAIAEYMSDHFNLMTLREHNTTSFTDDDGIKHQLEYNKRHYIPSEITWMLETLGFESIEIFGAALGAFSRNDKLKVTDVEMLVIAVK